MDEQGNQDFQDLNNPAPTGSQSTRRPPRRRGARAQRKPTQMEILTENVRSLIEVVRALVDREAHNAQYPPAQQEAAKSTPSRPPRSASRPRNPSPPGDRRSNPEPFAAAEDNPYRNQGEAEDVRRNATSIFDSLGRPGIYQRVGRERSMDKPTESHDRRIYHLQRQLDRLVGQQYGMEQVRTVDPPFTPAVMAHCTRPGSRCPP
ncbi:hypothetical protein TIFTF001_014162 [Ficus carica]|uniref:Uncharacterized protein n=1 Tax=Ficus carica TaxID=3494 RepID=A0AA87ZWA7_FICCA|nr:hypothetical protein TIFTF001_014162 [Ficus carica]